MQRQIKRYLPVLGFKQQRELRLDGMGALGSRLDGPLNHTEWPDRPIAFGQRAFAQADAQSRACDLQGANSHLKPVSDFVPADSLCHPVFNSRDIAGSEFSPFALN